MNGYIGEVGSRITAEVTMINVYEYKDYNFSYYGTTHYIYTMKDQDENILVWKTTTFMGCRTPKGGHPISKGDVIQITGTVKAHDEYKGTPQTVLNRCKFSVVFIPPTKEELEEQKRKEQVESLSGDDFIWEMQYRQYKEHYSDCETLAGSFQTYRDRPSTIKVIIREGRLKNSGTRGRRFYQFIFKTEDGGHIGFKAICEENARKQMLKQYPNSQNWELDKIF